MGKAQDLTGKVSGRLTAIRKTEDVNSSGSVFWLCSCECGNEVKVSTSSFNSGHTKSCGCITKKHGRYGTPEYISWRETKARCFNKNRKSYEDYGAKGITMCDQWKCSFSTFLNDMGEQPKDGEIYTLDRKDPLGDYSPDNCRWATLTQQARNKSGLPSNNTSGVKGVRWDNKASTIKGEEDKWYAVAYWRDLNGKSKSKSYSLKKYGEELAFFLACEYRQQQIDLLNLQGAGYGEKHEIREHL